MSRDADSSDFEVVVYYSRDLFEVKSKQLKLKNKQTSVSKVLSLPLSFLKLQSFSYKLATDYMFDIMLRQSYNQTTDYLSNDSDTFESDNESVNPVYKLPKTAFDCDTSVESLDESFLLRKKKQGNGMANSRSVLKRLAAVQQHNDTLEPDFIRWEDLQVLNNNKRLAY